MNPFFAAIFCLALALAAFFVNMLREKRSAQKQQENLLVLNDEAERGRRREAAAQAEAISRLEFGDYDPGPEYKALVQSVVDGTITVDQAVQKLKDDVKREHAAK